MNNRSIVVDHIQKLAELDNRYSNISCVNYDPATQARRGCFSIVFRAYDKLTEREVAIKMFDPDPQSLGDVYRFSAFEREPRILKDLIGKPRCLQLVADQKTYNVNIEVPNGVVSLPCHYFVVEWLNDQIDEFFEMQNTIASLSKLRLIHQISLAIRSLHFSDVQHRDLKADNLRLRRSRDAETVVAIDLGASARAFDPKLMEEYTAHMGARGYAAPETILGFAGSRMLGKGTDYYAIGCLLFELFNSDIYYRAVRNTSSGYDLACSCVGMAVARERDESSKLDAWHSACSEFQYILKPAAIDSSGSSVPISIARELNELLSGLTQFDFKNRYDDMDRVLEKIISCIRILENAVLEKKKRTHIRYLREKRKAAILARLSKAQSSQAIGSHRV